ncbi:PTS system glucose-specific transporter subunit [Citrobacter koseri]|uniref:PTS system glucose-specific EIIA component n=1 Tax=Citrobacter koseri TaxID=545 RepID=A0A2X2XQ03_CITKO|nr:PTS system glucose-specific transporter subunit [Citrobacter koseri]
MSCSFTSVSTPLKLKGEGFKRIAEEGQRVKVGDPVIEFDLPLLEEKAKSTLTPVVISNMDEIKELIKLSGSVTVGETPVIRIKEVILAAGKNGADWRHFFILVKVKPRLMALRLSGLTIKDRKPDKADVCLMALRLSGLQ